MNAPAPPPGWYPDPAGSGGSRHWDGEQWSQAVRGPQRTSSTGAVVGVVLAVVALALGSVVLLRSLASSGAAGTGSGPASTTTRPAGTAVAGPCTYALEGAPARPVEPPTDADVATSGRYEVALDTTAGPIAFVADAARTPCALGSLRALSRAGYFDGTPCHRLTTGEVAVLQCGDPTGTGSGGPGYVFDDEALEGATYARGTVAMANRGPGTNGSQFFLVHRDSPLPADYTPLGRITRGLEVLDRVASGGSDDSNGPGDGRPRTPVQIRTLRVAPQ